MADSYLSMLIFHLFFSYALLVLASACSTSTKGKFQDLQIVRRDASRKLLYNSRQNIPQEKPLKLGRNLGEFGEDIVLTLTTKDDINFLVTVGFGTPEREFTLLFDTGSDLTWIPCQPCADCNPQNSFNPSSSSTFSNTTCDGPNCNAYSRHYNDGSNTNGYYANDTLTITSNHIPSFIFGCAQEIKGNFAGANGLLAVGQGQFSLVAQTNLDFLGTFCYCLPPSKSSSGYMVFGVQAFDTCQPDSSKLIQIVPDPNGRALTSYYIPLSGITIGEKRIEVASYMSSKSINTIIDSGTTISRLPSSLYSALKSAFQEIMSVYPNTTSSEPDLLDTCYNLEGQSNWRAPNMVLHFGNVDVNLDASAAITTGKSDSEVCLAFAGNKQENDLVIIGNQQHRALNLFFDTGDPSNRKVGFNTDGCNNIINA